MAEPNGNKSSLQSVINQKFREANESFTNQDFDSVVRAQREHQVDIANAAKPWKHKVADYIKTPFVGLYHIAASVAKFIMGGAKILVGGAAKLLGAKKEGPMDQLLSQGIEDVGTAPSFLVQGIRELVHPITAPVAGIMRAITGNRQTNVAVAEKGIQNHVAEVSRVASAKMGIGVSYTPVKLGSEGKVVAAPVVGQTAVVGPATARLATQQAAPAKVAGQAK